MTSMGFRTLSQNGAKLVWQALLLVVGGGGTPRLAGQSGTPGTRPVVKLSTGAQLEEASCCNVAIFDKDFQKYVKI